VVSLVTSRALVTNHTRFTWFWIDEIEAVSTGSRATVRRGVAVRFRFIRIILDCGQGRHLIRHDGRVSFTGLAVGGGSQLAADSARLLCEQRQRGEDRQRHVDELAVSTPQSATVAVVVSQ